ncbi:MAG: hypothetical protein AAF487_00810 [Bacteroidota bacterium]
MLYRIGLLSFILIFTFSCQEKKEKRIPFSEVKEIVHRNCFGCHHPGGAAPFTLYTHDQIKRKANTIKDVVENGVMPPWPANSNYTHFIDEKKLTSIEKNALIKWIEQGAQNNEVEKKTEIEGQGAEEKWMENIAVDLYSETKHVQRFEMISPIELAGDNRDKFYYVKIPVELEKDTFIKSVSFIPGNRERVHHMNGHWLNYDYTKKEKLAEGKSYVNAEENTDLRKFLELGIEQDDGSFPELKPSVVNYLPGMNALHYPDGIGGFKANRKSTLLIQSIHYGPNSKDSKDQSSVEIEFMDKAPNRPLLEMQLGSLGISPIEPAFVLEPESKNSFRTQWTTDKNLSLLTIIPHMHLLGTKFKAYALSPQNDTIRLIKIDRWDFRWQYHYTFPKIKVIPKGYTIVAEAEFDNTSENPNQAFFPPKRIVEPLSLNMKTTDEMFQLILMYIDHQDGDENISLELQNGAN